MQLSERERHEEEPKTLSDVVIGLFVGTISIGILCSLYLFVKILSIVKGILT